MYRLLTKPDSIKRRSNGCPRHERPTWSYEVIVMAKDKNQKPKAKPKPKK